MPFSPQPVAELLTALQRALSALGVRWFLFGAQAAILYGVARLSADVDVTVDPGRLSAAELAGALATAGFESRVPDIARFAETTRVLPLVHAVSGMPLDVVLSGPGLEEQFFAGVREHVIGDARVPVVCPEDLVAMKVLAGRPRDLDDVAAIARVGQDHLDLDRVRGTLRLLESALDRRDLVSELERVVAAARRPSAEPPA